MQATETQNSDSLMWATVSSPAFSVEELISNYSKQELLKKGI